MFCQVSVTFKIVFLCLAILRITHSFYVKFEKCRTESNVTGFCRNKCYSSNELNATSKCLDGQVCCQEGKTSSMCTEYGDAVYIHPADDDEAIFLPIFRPTVATKVADCGIAATPLIIGGEKALPKEFPHMAAIGFGKTIEKVNWMCGGSLISNYYILTAAHCMETKMRVAKWVKLGFININDSSPNTQIYEVIERIPHPEYQQRINDIALLKVNREIKFTAYIRPACLDFNGEIAEKSAYATGWGKTDFEASKGSDDLMKVQLDIIQKDICMNIFKRPFATWEKYKVINSVICAGVLAGGKDTCQGDSGGPLQVVMKDPYCMYKIIGVSSFGKFCGFKGTPAIYTRVFYYIPWIESIVFS